MSFTFNDFNASVLKSIHSFGGKTGNGIAFELLQFSQRISFLISYSKVCLLSRRGFS